MIDLQNDPTTWDLAIVNGDLNLVSNADCVQQFLIQRLKLFRGEWFLDLSAGVPYWQDVLVKNPNPILIDGVFKDAIIETEGVTELTSFSADYDPASRQLTLDFSVNSLDGPIEVSTGLGG